MKPKAHTSESQGSKKWQTILHILNALESGVEEFVSELKEAKAAHLFKKDSDLIRKIETIISDPLSGILTTAKDVSSKYQLVVDIIIRSYFSEKKDLISAAYKLFQDGNKLVYGVVLVDDTIGNREKIWEFLDLYEKEDAHLFFPVEIMFIPADICEDLDFIEQISLGNESTPESSLS